MTTIARSGGRGAWIVASVLAALTCVHTPPLRAEEAATESAAVTLAEQRAAEAFQAYSKKDYTTAVALYLEAYEAAPSGSILYNIARIYDTKLADRPLAIAFYRRYIADPGAYTERIEFANERLQKLREADLLTSKLAVTEATPKADATTAAGADSRSKKEPSREPATAEGERWSALRWSGIVVGVVGMAALATGASFGLVAMSKANTANELCDGNACTSQRGVDAARSAKSAATIANIGFVGGGALLATGTALFVLGADDATERSPAAALRRRPLTGFTLQVTGRW